MNRAQIPPDVKAAVDAMPGVKEDEIRKLATCALCKQKVGAAGPVLYRVSIEQIALDVRALQRQTGLAMMLGGNGLLANIMGPNDDMAKVVRAGTFAVCNDCLARDAAIAILLDLTGEAGDR